MVLVFIVHRLLMSHIDLLHLSIKVSRGDLSCSSFAQLNHVEVSILLKEELAVEEEEFPGRLVHIESRALISDVLLHFVRVEQLLVVVYLEDLQVSYFLVIDCQHSSRSVRNLQELPLIFNFRDELGNWRTVVRNEDLVFSFISCCLNKEESPIISVSVLPIVSGVFILEDLAYSLIQEDDFLFEEHLSTLREIFKSPDIGTLKLYKNIISVVEEDMVQSK